MLVWGAAILVTTSRFWTTLGRTLSSHVFIS